MKRVIKFKVVEDLSPLGHLLPYDNVALIYKVKDIFKATMCFSQTQRNTLKRKVVEAANNVNYIVSNRIKGNKEYNYVPIRLHPNSLRYDSKNIQPHGPPRIIYINVPNFLLT